MAYRDAAAGTSSQYNSTGVQATGPARGRTREVCSASRTYSSVSIPFLAGGETKLPNVFNAVLTGAANIVKSFRDWNKDPCIQDNVPPVSVVREPPRPPPPPPSRKASKPLQTKLSYFAYKAPSKSQATSTKDLTAVKSKNTDSSGILIPPPPPSSTVPEPPKVEAPTATKKPEVVPVPESPAEIQIAVPPVVSQKFEVPTDTADVKLEDTTAPIAPVETHVQNAPVATLSSQSKDVAKQPPRMSIEDAIIQKAKQIPVQPVPSKPFSVEPSRETQDDETDPKFQPQKGSDTNVSEDVVKKENVPPIQGRRIPDGPSPPEQRSVETDTSKNKASVEVQASPKAEASSGPEATISGPSTKASTKKPEAVSVQIGAPAAPVAVKPRKSSGVSGHLDVKPSTITLHPIRTDVNIPAVKTKSAALTANLPTGIRGFGEARETRQRTTGYSAKTDEDKDFVDLFAAKGASKYVDALAKIEDEFLSLLEVKFKQEPGLADNEWLEVKNRLEQLRNIADVEDEKELQDFDFPMVLAHDIGKFNVDVRRKIEAMNEVHNYGVKKVLHWIYKLQKNMPLDPTRILIVATGLLVEMMIPSYGIFVRVAHYLADLAENPYAHHSNPPIGKLIHNVRNLVDTMADEIGAIGESSVQILIRIPGAEEDKIIEVVAKLYAQVQYADIALSRATGILIPIMKLYYLSRRAKSVNNQ